MNFNLDFNEIDQLLFREHKFGDDLPSLGELSRQESLGPSLPFRLHKREPEREKGNYCTNLDDLLNLDCEVRSSSTNADSAPHIEQQTVVDLVIRMIEEGRLSTAEYGFLNATDKLYIANILQVRNGTCPSPSLDNDDFVDAVNHALSIIKEKRNDDRLRFVYKRAVKYMLSHCSSYTANKLHRMQDFQESLAQKYFKNQPELAKEAMDTSFASKKKLSKLFMASASFKADFLSFSRGALNHFYSKYTSEVFNNMHKQLLALLAKDSNQGVDALAPHFKRLPWRSSEVQQTVQQIVKLMD